MIDSTNVILGVVWSYLLSESATNIYTSFTYTKELPSGFAEIQQLSCHLVEERWSS
jgi:hypothetical protein